MDGVQLPQGCIRGNVRGCSEYVCNFTSNSVIVLLRSGDAEALKTMVSLPCNSVSKDLPSDK